MGQREKPNCATVAARASADPTGPWIWVGHSELSGRRLGFCDPSMEQVALGDWYDFGWSNSLLPKAISREQMS